MYLAQLYKPILKWVKPVSRTVLVWSGEAIQCLQDCCTDWDLCKNICEDLDDLTEAVSSYVTFCENLVIPQRSFLAYPDNKPLFCKTVQNTIIQQNKYFNQGDITLYNDQRKKVRKDFKLAKRNYKDKVQNLFREGNSHSAGEGMKAMMGTQSKQGPISFSGMSHLVLSNALNCFYNCFDVHDFSQEISVFKNYHQQNSVYIDRSMVLKLFMGIKETKSPGPGGVGCRVLKRCAVQLSDIFCFIFIRSLQLCKVPVLWKSSITFPVPKN